MTGSAKQSIVPDRKHGLLRRFAPLRKRFVFVAGNDESLSTKEATRLGQPLADLML
jgi:hypothetical protein